MNDPSGPVPTPGQWARVQLAQGESSAGLWDLSSEVPEARIAIGSAPTAGWVVSAPDVAPIHFELFWDGSSLWTSPPHEGDLTVDGERVTSWRQLVGRSRVEFGRAAFLVETSQTIAMPPAGHALIDDEPVPTSPGVPRVPSAHEFDDDPTAALMSRPTDAGLPPLAGDATQMVDPSGLGGPAPRPEPAFGIAKPMLGGESRPVPRAGSAAAFGGELKTQILDTEAAGIDLRPSSQPPPPGLVPPGSGPGFGQQRQIQTDVLPSAGQSVSETGSQFALPPTVPQAETKKKFELPPRRTLILAGATLFVALIVLVMSVVQRQRREAAMELAAAQNASRNASETAEAIRAQAVEAAQQRAAARQAREEALRADVQDSIDDVLSDAETEAQEAVDEASEEEPLDFDEEKARRARFGVQKLAVDALARNDQRQGLAYYLWLQESYEDVEVYGQMVTVLREATRQEEGR